MISHKILLVLEKNHSDELSPYLESKGFEISSNTDSGEKALRSIEQNQPDIVLIDTGIKGEIDGFETSKIISKDWRIPVIFLSDSPRRSLIDRAKQSMPYGFIPKNYSNEDIALQIEFALNRYNAEPDDANRSAEVNSDGEMFHSIVNASRDAIFFMNRHGIIYFWNDAATEIFGYPRNDAVGKDFIELIVEDNYKHDFREGLRAWKYKDDFSMFESVLELYAKRQNGYIFPIELVLSPIEINHCWHACGFAKDVTIRLEADEEMHKLFEELQVTKDLTEQNASEMIELNAKLTESEEHLQELNASKDRFFSIISHDLRGPFQGLLAYSEILSSDTENLSEEEIKEFAGALNQSAQSVFKLLENLLHWSRIQRGVIEYDPQDIQFKLVSDMNIDLFMTRADQKKLKLTSNVPEDICVFGDVNMLNTVVRNLLSNAVKFTTEGDEIGIKAIKSDNGEILISVYDTGVGMSRDVIEKLFRIDQHHTTPGTDNEVGTGLGLILCKDLVEKNKGTISVESEEGKGTSFTFSMPKGNTDNLAL